MQKAEATPGQGVCLTAECPFGFTRTGEIMAEFPDILEASLRARFVSLGVHPGDVDERFVRGAGAGGQKINKTSSTVWLRHRPTGIEVRCQRERSQLVNRLLAWAELAERLAARRREAANAAQAARELARRQKRQKSRGQKLRMIEAKRHRAKHKSARGRVGDDY
ncbi:MAG TPA: peptide chain release factor-like protein [Lacunisphaera sp.]|nr:peptide chain release factor-like protein [Lacunisphaera sp.]